MGLTLVTKIESFFQYTEAGNESALFNQEANIVSESFIEKLRDGDVLVAVTAGVRINLQDSSRRNMCNITDLIRQGGLSASLNKEGTINFSMSKEKHYSYKFPWRVMDAILKKLNDPASASEIPGYEHCREVLFAQIFSAIPPHLMRPSLAAGD